MKSTFGITHTSAMSIIRNLVLMVLILAAVGIYFVFVIHLRNVNLTLSSTSHGKRLPKSRRVIVLISQPRSGSTFLGRVINMYEEMLYVYEPLQAVLKLNEVTNKSTKATRKYTEVATSFLKELFGCKFSSTKEDWLRKVFSSPMNFESSFSQLCRTITVKNARLCSEPKTTIFHSLCRKCKTLFVKLLEHRLPTPTDQLFQITPATTEMHVVYLTRDPRASFWSLLNKGWVSDRLEGYFENYISERCRESLLNIRRIAVGKRKIIILRYEDFLHSPLAMVRKLSNFLGEQMNLEFQENYLQLIHKDERRCSKNGTYINPTVTRPNWRTEANSNFVRIVEKHCKEVMDILGYRNVKNTVYSNCNNEYLVELEDVPLLARFNYKEDIY
ncbi:carbohydrate sulfotransferase 3-like [Rhopilema esculentum]|uniref:carbohydrate sulfotransferase 3-like n=1 Tax=Rhopilema esculentum TaxID=499914 RepID=UPI0031DB0A3D